MSVAVASLYQAARGVPLIGAAPTQEAVTFVATPKLALPPRDLAPKPVLGAMARHRAAVASSVDRPGPMSTVSSVVVTNEAPLADSTVAEKASAKSSATAGLLPSARVASLVFLRPSPLSRSSALGPTQRDSVVHQLTTAVPALARTRRPTQVEIDSFYREDALRQMLLREHGRPVPIVVGAVSISFPLFSRGPSRARRMRDSLIHHDNMLRFERIAERTRAKRDSSGRADSLTTKPDAVVP